MIKKMMETNIEEKKQAKGVSTILFGENCTITNVQEKNVSEISFDDRYTRILFDNVVGKFVQIIKILIPEVDFNNQYVEPHVYQKYVKQHIESHKIVPKLYLQHIMEMPWEKFVAEYLKDAVAISKQICEQIRRECTDIVNEDPRITKLRKEKEEQDKANIKLRNENRQLNAVIAAERLLNDIISGNTKITKSDSIMREIKTAGNPILPAKLKDREPLKVRNGGEFASSKKGKKLTANQTIAIAYENSTSWEDFLTTFDTDFIIKNVDEIKKFVKKLYGADKIDDNSLQKFNMLWCKLCPHGDFVPLIYDQMVKKAESQKPDVTL